MTRARILADYVSSGDELALKAPLAHPDDGKQYEWNEDTQAWDEV